MILLPSDSFWFTAAATQPCSLSTVRSPWPLHVAVCLAALQFVLPLGVRAQCLELALQIFYRKSLGPHCVAFCKEGPFEAVSLARGHDLGHDSGEEDVRVRTSSSGIASV